MPYRGKMTVPELCEYVKKNGISSVCYSTNNQEKYKVAYPRASVELFFASVSCGSSLRTLVLKGEGGTMYIDRVKFLTISKKLSGKVQVCKVCCGEVSDEDHDEVFTLVMH